MHLSQTVEGLFLCVLGRCGSNYGVDSSYAVAWLLAVRPPRVSSEKLSGGRRFLCPALFHPFLTS